MADDTGLNRLCFGGRTVPEISLINEDLPQKSSTYNGSLNTSTSRNDNGRFNFSTFPSPPPPSSNFAPFVPYHLSTSQHEVPPSSQIETLQLDLATLCRKNDDMVKLIRDQQSMIRDLKNSVLELEKTVSVQQNATTDRAIQQVLQDTARNIQGIPREQEIRQIIKEIMKEQTETITKIIQNAAISFLRDTCDKEVQVMPEVQDVAVQSQVLTCEREVQGNHAMQEETRNHRVERNGHIRDEALEIRQAERRQIPYPQPLSNGHNSNRARFADLHEVRESLPEIEGQQAEIYTNGTPTGSRPGMVRRPGHRHAAATRDIQNYRSPNAEIVEYPPYSSPAEHPPAFTSAAEAYHAPALPVRGTYGRPRLTECEELEYYPERGSPGPVRDYGGYDIKGNSDPARFPNRGRMRSDRNTRNPDRDNHFSQRGEESIIANQFVAKYLGAERLNRLQRLPPQQQPAPPRPPPHRRTIVTGNVSFAQFAVQTQYPSAEGNGHVTDRRDASPYAGHDRRYEDEEEQYDSWDDEPQGVPLPPSQRILDLTAIYNQPPAQ